MNTKEPIYARILAGPETIGNVFGFYGHLVPDGKFAVVTDGEYANGGYGPSAIIHRLFNSVDEAEAWAESTH